MAAPVDNETTEFEFIHEAINQSKVKATQIFVIVSALILNMLDGFDILAMSLTAHNIGEQLSIPADKLGIIFSFALIGMTVGAMFLAPLSDVIGRRKMVLGCVLAIGSSTFLTGFATSLTELVVLRLITGLGVGGMLASLAAITSEYTPEKYKSFAVVTVTTGYPLGIVIGGYIAAPILEIYDWPIIFFAGGTATLTMVVIAFFLIPESLQFLTVKRPASALEKVNRILVKLGRQALDKLPDLPASEEIKKANVFSLLTKEWRIKTITLWASFFFCFITLYFMMSWIPKLAINAGMAVSEGAYALVLFNAGAVVGTLTLGWLSARIPLSRLIGTFLFSAGVLMIIFAQTSGLDHLFIYLFIIGYTLQGGFTGLYAAAAKMYPTDIRTTGVGWGIGLGRLGAVAGPYFGGLLIAGGASMEINFFVFAVPMLISGLIALKLAVR